MPTTPVEMLLFAIAGWLNEEQRHKIEFLQEQVRVLQELKAFKWLRSSWNASIESARGGLERLSRRLWGRYTITDVL